MACVILQKDYKQWFAELNIDLDKVSFYSKINVILKLINQLFLYQILEITRHILNLYELWKGFDMKKDVPGK